MTCPDLLTGVCTASVVLFFLQEHFGFWMIVATSLSLCVGSFLNVVIYRLPLMLSKAVDQPRMNLCFPGSHCPHCSHPITAQDNIPVIAYIRLRGKCRHCQAPVALRYPLVELSTGCLCAVSAWILGPTSECLLSWVLLWFAIAASLIVWDNRTAKRSKP